MLNEKISAMTAYGTDTDPDAPSTDVTVKRSVDADTLSGVPYRVMVPLVVAVDCRPLGRLLNAYVFSHPPDEYPALVAMNVTGVIGRPTMYESGGALLHVTVTVFDDTLKGSVVDPDKVDEFAVITEEVEPFTVGVPVTNPDEEINNPGGRFDELYVTEPLPLNAMNALIWNGVMGIPR